MAKQDRFLFFYDSILQNNSVLPIMMSFFSAASCNKDDQFWPFLFRFGFITNKTRENDSCQVSKYQIWLIFTDSHKKERKKKTRQNDSSQTAATKLGLFSISKQWRFNNCCQNSRTKMSQLSNLCGSNLHVRCNYRYETYPFDTLK
jgi:hypothetical protein